MNNPQRVVEMFEENMAEYTGALPMPWPVTIAQMPLRCVATIMRQTKSQFPKEHISQFPSLLFRLAGRLNSKT